MKIISECIPGINIILEVIKVFKENTVAKVLEIGIDYDFLNLSANSTDHKTKASKQDCIKLKSFCLAKHSAEPQICSTVLPGVTSCCMTDQVCLCCYLVVQWSMLSELTLLESVPKRLVIFSLLGHRFGVRYCWKKIAKISDLLESHNLPPPPLSFPPHLYTCDQSAEMIIGKKFHFFPFEMWS